MGATRLPDTYLGKVREQGGSLVITIPAGAVDDLELEPEEEPERFECDADRREVTFEFGE